MTAEIKPERTPTPPASLAEEAEMLEAVIPELYEQVIQSRDFATATRAMQRLGEAADRLKKLTEALEQEEGGSDGVKAAFWKAFAETIQELRGREQER